MTPAPAAAARNTKNAVEGKNDSQVDRLLEYRYNVDVGYNYINGGDRMTIRTNEELISVREAARECERNMETVRRWIWGGKLPAQKLGNQLFIKKSDFASFCRETAIREYEAKPKPDFLKRAIALQKRIKARGGKPINAVEEIRKMREERMNELEQRLR